MEIKQHDDFLNFIREIADSKLDEIRLNGYAKAGNNGSYFCIDTPVRNSAHWCVSYGILFDNTGDEKYLNVLRALAEYLASEQQKTSNGTVKCMTDGKFDSINGLIGQAWAIEGLIKAAEILNDEKYYYCAVRLFNSQKFDESLALWDRIDIDGYDLGKDMVFNHQLWFAASGAIICSYKEEPEIRNKLDMFMNNCYKHIKLYKSGLIMHYCTDYPMGFKVRIKRGIKNLLPDFIKQSNPDKYNPFSYEASYHLFNLYGFSLIKRSNPDYVFFKSSVFKKALDFGMNIKTINELINVNDKGNPLAKFSYAYNSPAYEFAFVQKTFTGSYDRQINEELWDIHNRYCYSEIKKSFDSHNDDPETLTARIYEYLRVIE